MSNEFVFVVCCHIKSTPNRTFLCFGHFVCESISGTMETVICFICSSRTSDFHQNFNELHTTHSKAGLTVLLRRILKDSLMQRNIHFHLNCICTNCFDDINDYDRMCVEVLEKESKLRDRLLVTDAAIFSEQIKTKSKRNASNEPEMEIFTIELDDDSDPDDQQTTTAEMLQATLPEQNSCRTLDNLIKRVLDDRLQTEKNCTKCPKRFSSNEKFKVSTKA